MILLRIYNDEIDFKNCKFNLGKYSNIVNYVAGVWLIYTMISVLLPNLYLPHYGMDT